MAEPSDIAELRLNVEEPTTDNYTDEVLNDYIDAFGVAGSSAKIWRHKAAKYAELVTTTQGGTQHQFSDLHKAALNMAKSFDSVVTVAVESTSGPIVKSIVRE